MRADLTSPREHPRFRFTQYFLTCFLNCFSCCLLVAAPRSALADIGKNDGARVERAEGQQTELSPPELVEYVAAEYPSEAVGSGREGRVVLRLTVDEQGAVREAHIEEGLGPELDDAARHAALGCKFSPARRGSDAVPASILFSYDFSLPVHLGATEAARPVHEEPPPVVAPSGSASSGSAPSGSASSDASASEQGTEQLVTVKGRSLSERLRRSPQAVQVVDLTDGRRESADLAQILSRAAGVTVQRAGGLGSRANFSLAGLSGEQVRFFIDGVPLRLAGFPFGAENVPVNLVDRVDIYEGVVPIELGADALGGAVQLVTFPSLRSNRAAASYQVGSFHTHRLTASAQGFLPESGWTARLSGYLDSTKNDYDVDVTVTGQDSRPVERTLPRFFDGYLAGGGKLSLGVVDKPYAERLLLSGFVGAHHRDIQSNLYMTTPYGEVTLDKTTAGANVSHAVALSGTTRFEGVGGYTYVRTRFVDVSRCKYDWRGECIFQRSEVVRGEIEQIPTDRTIEDHAGFARLLLATELAPTQTWRVSFAPTYERRTGDDAELDGHEFDELNFPQTVASLVTGAEWGASLLDDRFKNLAFVKAYGQFLQADERLATGETASVERSTFVLGGGDAARYFLSDDLYLKGSYEYAARLPGASEVFGDGGQVERNLDLVPERSQNINLGIFGDAILLGKSSIDLSALGFARFSDDLIFLAGGLGYQQYQNVRTSRALGVEGKLAWALAPFVRVLGSITYQDLRNRSKTGAQAAFFGDRIPNRPPVTASGEAHVSLHDVTSSADSIELGWRTRYVHGFYRTWESAGTSSSKDHVPSQASHDLVLTYLNSGNQRSLSTSLEVQNLTNAKLYDYYSAQRPGRAFFCKLTFETR